MIKVKCIKHNEKIFNMKNFVLYKSKPPFYCGPLLLSCDVEEVIYLTNLCCVCANAFDTHCWCFKNTIRTDLYFKTIKHFYKNCVDDELFDVYFDLKKRDIENDLIRIYNLIDNSKYEEAIELIIFMGNDYSCYTQDDIFKLCKFILQLWYCTPYPFRSLVARRLYYIVDNILKTYNFDVFEKDTDKQFIRKKIIRLHSVINQINHFYK